MRLSWLIALRCLLRSANFEELPLQDAVKVDERQNFDRDIQVLCALRMAMLSNPMVKRKLKHIVAARYTFFFFWFLSISTRRTMDRAPRAPVAELEIELDPSVMWHVRIGRINNLNDRISIPDQALTASFKTHFWSSSLPVAPSLRLPIHIIIRIND